MGRTGSGRCSTITAVFMLQRKLRLSYCKVEENLHFKDKTTTAGSYMRPQEASSLCN
ncbi:hypothetical protein GDO81_008549 [Engystomops pustulosus]|uniref:Uncharacterized protein n=1 Tax=Engystomops pustulosus TaxID=76066 RepID=A0AAV7CFH2_ENGPU|nr:hypothetical protein GDO81_008549 [Engystomops pustulosus]KAG8583789.1 hypothetical protein GDO81_008549 [Engystomops pustulosus]KAG8583790.1 hypothetical protein GDO81_008549 [Engystomops pustulosus]